MSSEQALMQKLMISKKIMDKHDTIGRSKDSEPINTPNVQSFQPVQGTYNIPDNLVEQDTSKKYNTETPTRDRITNSKLPEDIKKLMIEHPIDKPNMGVHSNVGLTDDLVEKASRLMNNNSQNNVVNEQKQQNNNLSSDIKTTIRDVVRDTVRDVLREELKEAGMLVESTNNSNETIQFKVGKHLFVGKVLKVKKMSS